MERFLKTPSETPAKKRKRSINPSFLDKYGIADVIGKGICVMCSKELAEESLKPNKLQRHMETHANIAVLSEEARKRIFHHRYENLTKSQAILCRTLSQKEKMEIFSYETAFLIAQQKRPFTEGETIIKPALKNFCEVFEDEPFAKKIREAVDDATLSNNTITRRLQGIAADLKEQILEDFRNSPWTALAVDESTDITSQPQLLIFGRFLKESSVIEELLTCISLETTTKGEDIFNAVDKFFTENNLDWSKVIECSMDGAPSMMGKNIGVRGILSRKHPHIKTNHCIIHRQSLASKDMSPNFADVMQVVISTVNYVKARDLNSRMFKQLCVTENSNHHTLLMHTAVRWLSRGKTLERVFLLRRELATFLQDQGHKNACYFRDPHFLARLALLTDVFEHINKLNTELQGKEKWVFDLQGAIKAFVSKLQIIQEEAEADSYSHLHHYLEFTATKDIDFDEALDLAEEKQDLLKYLQNLRGNMNARFPKLLTESFDFVQFPFKTDAKQCGSIALEMADLQADNEARVDFDVYKDIGKFWINLANRHSAVKNRALQVLVQFGTTYVCEAAFSSMVFIKNYYRSRMTAINLENCMVCCLTSYTPRYRKLIKQSK